MSGNNHRYNEPRGGYGGCDSDRYGERGGSAGRNGNGGGGYNGGGPGQHVGTRVTIQMGVVRSEPDPRVQYDGRGSEYDGGGESG